LQSENPSSKHAKLHPVATSNNRDHISQDDITLAITISKYPNCWPVSQELLLEVTHQDHSIIACSRLLFFADAFQ